MHNTMLITLFIIINNHIYQQHENYIVVRQHICDDDFNIGILSFMTVYRIFFATLI